MSWLVLTLAIVFQVLSSLVITLSATPSILNKKELSDRLKATLAIVGLMAAGLGYYLLAIAVQDLSLITAYGMWGGASVLSSTVVLLVFYPRTWTWKRNFFLLLVSIGMIGLLYTG